MRFVEFMMIVRRGARFVEFVRRVHRGVVVGVFAIVLEEGPAYL